MLAVIVDTTLTTPPTGGAHTFLVDLCCELVKRGWSVSVITQRGPDHTLLKALSRGGVEICADLWRRSHLPEERARLLARWVRNCQPDVYVISTSPDVGWLALPHLEPNVATVSLAHNDIGAFYEPLSHYHPFIDIAVGVSAEIYRKILAIGVPLERARQIPYGVRSVSPQEIDARCSSPRDQRLPLEIVYVGRVVQEQKRVMDLAPIAVSLKRRKVEFRLNVIGDGSDREHLQYAFKSSGADDCVKFWGWQLTDRVKDLLKQMDVFLLTSDYEGLPVALLEAMSHGLAPVVTRIASGNTQLVNDAQNGYLVDIADIEGFSDRLSHLAEDSALLRKIQSAAWETSTKYSVSKMTQAYVQCFADSTASKFSQTYRSNIGENYPPMPSCISRYPFWLRKIKYLLTDWTSKQYAAAIK